MKKLLTGNEAIARGAYEYGVSVATAYPGTPSTEILENVATYKEIYSQWSPNEKVALEVGAGAAIAGARTLVAMKHVGVNVAADPLFTLSYTGVNGGLVLVSADDPGMHSSQNEQDNRNYAKFAKIPLLEPSDSQEAKDFVGAALEISERFDTPVLLRSTTRISHSKSLVELHEPVARKVNEYQKNPKKYVMIPAYGRLKHVEVENRLVELRKFSETTELNRIEWGDRKIGVVTSGICYQYVKEALPHASVLKLGFTNPLPLDKIRKFAEQVETLYVVEELDPFMEEQIKAAGISCVGKEEFPLIGEITPGMIRSVVLGEQQESKQGASVPVRPPVMCPGCPHRGVFYTLKKLGLNITGDIGCYTLGALPPLEAMHTCICMGASIGAALGMEKANPELADKTVAVIGDSTFMHSGITGLLDIVYNKGTVTTMILDNSITAMTGHQHHPGTGYTLSNEATHAVDVVALVKSLGIERVRVVDPFDLEAVEQAVREETAAREPSVIIAKRPCALIVRPEDATVEVEADKCVGCKACMKLGCPALNYRDGKVVVNTALCTACGVCLSVCPVAAIKKEGGQNE